MYDATDTDAPIIAVESVRKAFASRPVLEQVTFSIRRAEAVCLCGVNGAGKSTLMRIMAGLLRADGGRVLVGGHDVSRDPDAVRPLVGVISHKSMVYADLTVLENLLFFARLYGAADADARVAQLLEQVRLSAFRYDRAAVLSRGLLQRLSVARALVHGPAILLADEPFTGLDSEACTQLVETLTAFTASGGALVMTTHDVGMGLRCCTRVLVLDGRRILFDQPTAGLDAAALAQDYLSYARARDRH